MVFVISATDKKLMPTTEYRARKLLKSRKAAIYKYRPFTIKLTVRESGYTQPIEYCCDTGYQHIGISIKSHKHEYVNEQRDLLKDETEHHNDCRKYRSSRRNRKTRYRKMRWNNRKSLISKDGFAPSIRNKRDVHVNLFKMYYEVCPITSAHFEMGQFDTQLLKAIEEGKSLPQGTDYQHGEQYGYSTLREAVFNRDNYKCIVCGKSALKDKIMLKIHHLGYLNGDRTNQMNNLATVCNCCHTPKNHKEGGKLYGLRPKFKSFKGATFMTTVRYDMFNKVKEAAPEVSFHMTYGALTKLNRNEIGIKKSHSNDAYAMGEFYPKHRADFKHYQKRRRNNRILSKFYDAKYIDIRDRKTKSGQQLSCNRANRRELRNSDKNERIYRGQKTSKGKTVIRKTRYDIQAGDIILFKGKKYSCHGAMSNGKSILLANAKESTTGKAITVSYKSANRIKRFTGWQLIS